MLLCSTSTHKCCCWDQTTGMRHHETAPSEKHVVAVEGAAVVHQPSIVGLPPLHRLATPKLHDWCSRWHKTTP